MTSPAIIANTPDPITRQHLRDQCAISLERRQESYPGMIASGRIDEEAAARDIEGWQMLLLEWTWNCLLRADGIPPSPPSPFILGLSDPARAMMADAVETSLRRLHDELSGLGGGGAQRPALLRQQDIIRTLRLHIDADPRAYQPERPNSQGRIAA